MSRTSFRGAPLINRIRKYFSSRPEALSVVLYGSQASGLARSDSDVDVAVLLKKERPSDSFERKMQYQDDLECALRKNVDVVILNDADLFLVQQVLTKGRTIWDANKQKSDKLKWRLISLWWDFIPVKRIYDEAAIARLKGY